MILKLYAQQSVTRLGSRETQCIQAKMDRGNRLNVSRNHIILNLYWRASSKERRDFATVLERADLQQKFQISSRLGIMLFISENSCNETRQPWVNPSQKPRFSENYIDERGLFRLGTRCKNMDERNHRGSLVLFNFVGYHWKVRRRNFN